MTYNKNRKIAMIKKICVYSICLVIISYITGCKFFNQPMLDYLEEWTNTAQVSKHTFDDTYPVIGDITNIPSGKDRVITYYLINPQSYDLGIEVTFDPSLGWDPIRTDNHPDYATTSNQGTVEQDATDKSIIRLTLNKNALASLDGTGTEISPTVSIMEPNSGRTFGSYTVPVRVNSLPPRLFNAVIMKYRDSNEKYAVCFSLPAMGAGDIHRDITQITVNGTFNGQPFNKTYRVTGGGTGTISVEGLETSSISNYEVIGSEFVDMGTTFVGIKTGLDLGPTTPTCTITLTDSSGASTVTTVSTVSTLLNKIYVNENSGDDNNTGTVSSPVKTIGNALEKLRDVPKGNVILQSDISLTGEVTVGSGISATVTTDGSGRTVTNGAGRVFNITSGGSLILGENITLTGTNAGGSGGAVYVDGGSFTMESGSKITGSSADYGGGVYIKGGTFTMKSGSSITGSSAGYAGGGVYVNDGNFTMDGGTIGGTDINSSNTAGSGGGVYVNDQGSFTMSGGIISGNTATGTTANGGGVHVGGTFTMSGTATIKGNTASNGGGVCVYSGGVFTMSGGIIGGSDSGSANTALYGGGVYVDSSNFGFGAGTFDMSGGTIIGNEVSGTVAGGGGVCVQGNFTMSGNATISKNSAVNGGGVYVTVAGATFTMSGGTIGGDDANSANTASSGGGVYVVNGCTFTMSGTATIKGNTASSGGGVQVGGTFSVSGSPTITGNTVSGNANNVYLPGGKTITIGDGGLTGGTIGVTAGAITPGNAVKITDKNVTGAANRFTSDVADYTIMEGIAPMEDAVYLFGGNIGTDVNIEVVYSSGGKVQFGTFEKARAASATEITLLKDITPTTAPTVSWPITFKWTCTLDLNGHAINRELSSETDDGQVVVISSNGNLTIKDSSVNADGTGGIGKITGGYDSGNGQNYGDGGGGIYVEGGSLTLESGSITGNKTFNNGGGVYVGSGGTFTMKGGSITDNTADNKGGGVYVDSSCTFTMTGGFIGSTATPNKACMGGGIYIWNGNVTISGNAQIIGNQAKSYPLDPGGPLRLNKGGGGVYLLFGTLTMSGNSCISENMVDNEYNISGEGGGVYVEGGTFTQGTGKVENNTPDNVYYQNP